MNILSLVFLAAGAAGHGGDASSNVAVQIADRFGVTPPLLVSQIVCFVIVALALKKFAYGPVIKMLEERRKLIEEGLANAEKARRDMAETEKRTRELLTQASSQADAIIAEAKDAAARIAAAESQKAIAQAEQIIRQAHEVALMDREKMKSELRREIGALVIQTTAKVLGKVVSAEDQKRLNDETARELV
ncbi:MAG: F0F1 ATP synthase subunit B [Verrucomicrobiae bacterium]|nr:F0F1 ATP synthase subunit B [Verrucomicrobiae bacterium]